MQTSELPPIKGLATELFRREHFGTKECLEKVSNLVEKLHAGPGLGWRDMTETVIRLLRTHIVPHAEWEEKALYPVVDRYAGGGFHPFTASMRHEHKIIARQLEDLARESLRPNPSPRRFARQADHLLGLISAHFEEEEEVLLTILDSSMTAEEFKREVMDREVGAKGACHPALQPSGE